MDSSDVDAGRGRQLLPRAGAVTEKLSSNRFVAFYESAQQSGYYAELGCGRDSVALTNLQAPAPWDDAMLDLVIAAEHENAKRALVASERVSG
jgi:hypothetical protein